MTPELSLDFTEQLLMLEFFGNVFATQDFIQANEVSLGWLTWYVVMTVLLTTEHV